MFRDKKKINCNFEMWIDSLSWRIDNSLKLLDNKNILCRKLSG